MTLVPSLYVTGLALALLIQREGRFNVVLRSLLFMPQTVSLVVVALVWQVLLVDKIGVINQFISLFGLSPISWLGDPRFALYTVTAISVWFLMGFYMLIFLGGLQDIPREYYEAARIDGANRWQMFFRITLPLLKPTSLFVIVISLIASFQVFDQIWVMTRGGPARATEATAVYIYQQAFQYLHLGYGSAVAFVLFVVILSCSLIQFRLLRTTQS